MFGFRGARALFVAAVVVSLSLGSTSAMAAPGETEPEPLDESAPDDEPGSSPTRHQQPVTDDDRQLTGDVPPQRSTAPERAEPRGDALPTDDVAPSTSAQSSLAPTVVDPDAPVGVPDAYVTPNDRVLSVAAPGTPTGTPRR